MWCNRCAQVKPSRAGKFKDEIIPIQAFKYKIKNGKRIRETVTFDMDDGVRWPATMENMAKLKSPFRLGGTVLLLTLHR